MNQTILIVAGLVIALLVVALLALAAANRKRRSAELREKFGPEYEHAVERYSGDRSRAEEDLEARAKRVEALDIRPLRPEEREHFQEEWRSAQAEFVDAPDRAIDHADRLVKQVMQARGYPMGDFEQRAADISVDHPAVVTHYRTAHDIALRSQNGKAGTEDLRQAMVHYRALFEELLRGETPEAEGRRAA